MWRRLFLTSLNESGCGGRWYPVVKRIIDVAVALTAIVCTAPAWVAIAIAVKFSDGGPILYSGVRVGRFGVTFEMHKFRTMVVNAEDLGGPSTASDDHRITRVGHWLRRWKLDELPQFVNVLRGQMSLVGPRPQVASDVARYSEDERRLLLVKPGITDWASVQFSNEGDLLRGHADPDAAYDEFVRPEKIRLGLTYVSTASLRTDLRILKATVSALVGHQPRIPA